MHWRRKWQVTPVFLPGESQGWGAWWASIYGVTQSRTWLRWLSSSSSSFIIINDHTYSLWQRSNTEIHFHLEENLKILSHLQFLIRKEIPLGNKEHYMIMYFILVTGVEGKSHIHLQNSMTNRNTFKLEAAIIIQNKVRRMQWEDISLWETINRKWILL